VSQNFAITRDLLAERVGGAGETSRLLKNPDQAGRRFLYCHPELGWPTV
jgi:hypothetical protein